MHTSMLTPFTLNEPISFTLHSELGDKLAGVIERIERKMLYVEPVCNEDGSLRFDLWIGDGLAVDSAVKLIAGEGAMLSSKLDDEAHTVGTKQHAVFCAMRAFDAVGELESISTDGETVKVELKRFPYKSDALIK